MDYKELLKKAQEKLPKRVEKTERFNVPPVKGFVQGSTTVISNFAQVASYLHRKPEHLLKYILRELAAPGELKSNGSVIIRSKIPSARINEKVEQYAKEFVICKECGKPDTQLIKEDRVSFVKCQACGSKRPSRELR